MEAIPRYRKQITGMETAVAPQVGEGWFTQEYRAMAGLGRDVSNLGANLATLAQKMNKDDDNRILMEMQTDTINQLTALDTQNTDAAYLGEKFGGGENSQGVSRAPIKNMAETQLADYQGLFDGVEKKYLSGLSEESQAKWGLYKAQQLHKIQLDVNKRQYEYLQSQLELSAFKGAEATYDQLAAGRITENAAQAQIEQYATALPIDKQEGFLDKAYGQLDKIVAEREKAAKEAQTQAIVNRFIADPEHGLDVVAVSTNLDGEQKREATSQLKLAIARRDKKLADDQRQSGIDALGIISSGQLPEGVATFDEWLANSPLNPTGENGRARYRSLWQQNADRRAEGKGSIFDENDPAKQLEIRRRISADPAKVTEEEILALVGKGQDGGLSYAAANQDLIPKLQAAKKELEPGAAKKPFAAKRGEEFLDKYGSVADRLPEYKEAVEEGDKIWLRARHAARLDVYTEWDNFVKANTDENGNWTIPEDAVKKKLLSITEPIRDEIKLSWFKYALQFTPLGGAYRSLKGIGPSTPKQEVARITIQTLKDDGTWSLWTEEQQAKAEQLAKQGVEINELIKRVSGY